MIYLVTGSPGTGKTSLIVKWLLDNKWGLFKDEYDVHRPLYTVGVEWVDKGRKLFRPTEMSYEDFQTAPLEKHFPTGSVIIVDEASEAYPARSMTSKLPEYLDGLNKLRHHGFTLILMTQFPNMIDPFVLALVGKHVHIERKQVGQKLYEWNSVQRSFSERAFSVAYAEQYKPDKRTYDLYKSSTKHIKFKKSIGKAWYALAILPFVIGGLYWFAFSSLQDLSGQQDESAQVVANDDGRTAAPQKSSVAEVQAPPQNLVASDFVPTLPERPESAPIYNQVRKVVDFPQVVGCVASDDSCNCYTQQGTLVTEMEENQCRLWVEQRPFNPYKTPEQREVSQPVVASQDGPEVMVMGGKSQQNLMYDGYLKSGEQFR